MFEITTKELGTVIVGVKQVIKFPYKEGGRITTMTSSCGCSNPIDDKVNSEVIVNFLPGNIPEHIIAEGKNSYTFKKFINVSYIGDDGTEKNTILYIKGTATK